MVVVVVCVVCDVELRFYFFEKKNNHFLTICNEFNCQYHKGLCNLEKMTQFVKG